MNPPINRPAVLLRISRRWARIFLSTDTEQSSDGMRINRMRINRKQGRRKRLSSTFRYNSRILPEETREFVLQFCQDSRFSDQGLVLSKCAAGPLFVYWHFGSDPNLVQESQPHIITQHFSVQDVITVTVSKHQFAVKHSTINTDGRVDIHTATCFRIRPLNPQTRSTLHSLCSLQIRSGRFREEWDL